MNPHKGDVLLPIGEKQYTLRYSHLALVKLENALDKSVVEIMDELQASQKNIRIGMVVALLWAGLQKHHPKMSQDDAADLLDEIDGGAAGAMEIIGTAFEKAFAAPGTKGTNPQANGASHGIGTASSSTSSVTATPQDSFGG